MISVRARVWGEEWFLVDHREAKFFGEQFVPVQSSFDVRQFVSCVDHHMATRALGLRPDRTSPRDLQRSIEYMLAHGSLRLLREVRPRPRYDPNVRIVPNEPLAPAPPIELEPFEESNKSLIITDCPAVFEPRNESLRITYLLRDLVGQSVELVIRSKAKPEPPVHRRPLAAGETRDGSSKLEWDGVDDGTGKPVDRDLSPFTVQLVHDGTYRDDAPTSIPPASLVHIVEMEDLVFATGRAILMPDGGVDEAAEGQERITGLHAIAAALRHAAFHTDVKLCVFGHTDTVGDDMDNLTLSSERATNVLHVLKGDGDAWAAHCDQRYEVADFQRVLKWIAVVKGWPTDPGPIDNDFGSTSRAARTNFRERMNAEYGTSLEQGVKQNVDDWKAYFVLFEEELARIMSGSARDLERIRGKLELTEPAALGCGEAFPAEAPGVNNLESATNRRVDLVFFDPDEVPDLSAEPAGSTLYGTKDYIAEYLPIGKGGGTCPVILRLLHRDQWLGGTKYRIELDGELIASGTTNADGWIEAELPKDTDGLELRVPSVERSFLIHVAELVPLPDLMGVQGRLANLGYLCPTTGELDDETREALKAFQSDNELPMTGDADGETIAALREIHDES